jgi:hypothetical protein
MLRTRTHIRLNTTEEASRFVAQLNTDGTADKYSIEDFDGVHRANARSLLGVIYAMSDFHDEMYLVNETQNGVYPSFVDAFRV